MHIIAASYRLILKSKHDLYPSGVGSVVFRDNWINWFVTQWRHVAGTTLAHIKDCCLTTPSNYVNQHLIRISEVLWHFLNSNLIMSAQFRYYVKWVWNYFFQMTATSLSGQWVDPGHQQDLSWSWLTGGALSFSKNRFGSLRHFSLNTYTLFAQNKSTPTMLQKPIFPNFIINAITRITTAVATTNSNFIIV